MDEIIGDRIGSCWNYKGLESPTESVSILPMSAVSELHFQQSVSEENFGFHSRRTSLSFMNLTLARHDEIVSRPFVPSFLVKVYLLQL